MTKRVVFRNGRFVDEETETKKTKKQTTNTSKQVTFDGSKFVDVEQPKPSKPVSKPVLPVKTPKKEDNIFKRIGGTFGRVSVAAGEGLLKGVEGMTDFAEQRIGDVAGLFSDKAKKKLYDDSKVNIVDNSKAVQHAKEVYDRYSYNPFKSGKIGDSIAQGVGQVASFGVGGELLGETKLAKTLANGGKIAKGASKALQLAPIFASSAGQGTSESLNKGASYGKANAYGLGTGAIEAGTESLFGGIGGVVGKGPLDDMVVNAVKKKISSKIGKELAELGIKATGEGLEEVVSGVLSPYLKRATYDKNAENYSLKQAGQDFTVGALTSGILQSPGTINNIVAKGNPFVKNSEKQAEKPVVQAKPIDQVQTVQEQQKEPEMAVNENLEQPKQENINPNLTQDEQEELNHLSELQKTPFMEEKEVARLNELQEKSKGITPLIKEMYTRQTEKEINNKTKELQKVLFAESKNEKTQLKQTINELANSKLTGEELKSEISKKLHENFKTKTIQYADEELKTIKKAIRNIRVKLTDELKLNVTDFNNVRKNNFGKVVFSKNGTEVDSLYESLSEQYPYIFDQDTINPYDRLNRIIEVANEDVIREEKYSLEDQIINEATESIYSYLSNKETIESMAEKNNPLIKKIVSEAVSPVKPNAPVNEIPVSDSPLLPTRPLTTKVLDETPEKETQILSQMKRDKMTIGESKDLLTQKLVNRGHHVDKMAKEQNRPEWTQLYDRTLSASSEGQFEVEHGQTDNEGNVIGASINEIFKPVEDSGLVKEFTQYMLHKHNIDRAKREKNVFGDDFTSEQSRLISDQLEQKYPQFKEWSQPIYKWYQNNLQSMVDAGLVSKSLQDYLGDVYNNYVRISRDKQKQPYNVPFKNTRANNPLKEAQFSNANILPLKDAMAELAIKTKQAIRTNELGLALFDDLEGIENLEEYKQEKGDIENAVKQEGSNATLSVFKDGEAYSIPISDELYESLKPITKNKVENVLPLRAIRKASNIQRDLLTIKNPLFLVTNFFKDAQDGVFNSKYPTKFAKNYIRAIKEIATNGKHYTKYMASGGESNTYFDYEKGVKKSPGKLGKFVEKIMSLNEAVEKAPRLAEFISTIEDGKTLTEAMYNAAEVTTNFKRGGDWTKALNRNGFNFLNASVQGFSKFQRNITGQNGFKGYVNVLAKATALGVVPSLLNHLLLGDDDDYKDLPDYVKDTYYLFKTSDNNFIRIPKGRAISIFGMAARRTLESVEGEKDAFKGLGDAMVNQIAPNNPQTSNLLTPFDNVKENKTWFGGDLVSKRLQGELPKNQWDETTDEFSKAVGNKLNVSPKKINYLLDQYSGGIGDVILPSITKEAHKTGILAPVSDKFTINSEMKNKNVSDFFDLVDTQYQIYNDSGASDKDILKYKYLSSKRASTNDLYKQKREIQLSKMSNEKKLQEVNKIQVKINKIAEQALKDYDKVKMISKDHAKIGDIEYFKDSKGWRKARY